MMRLACLGVAMLTLAAPFVAAEPEEFAILDGYLAEFDEVDALAHCGRTSGRLLVTDLVGFLTDTEPVTGPPTNRLLWEHIEWHDAHEGDHVDHNDAGHEDRFGEEFFRYHRVELDRYDQWRVANGHEPVAGWNPADPIPEEHALDDPGEACELRNDPYEPVPRPTWTMLAGGTEEDPLYGNTQLCDFEDVNSLGKSITHGYHASIHVAVGGVMAGPDPMLDPLFFASHRFLENIVTTFESECLEPADGATPASDPVTEGTPGPGIGFIALVGLLLGGIARRRP